VLLRDVHAKARRRAQRRRRHPCLPGTGSAYSGRALNSWAGLVVEREDTCAAFVDEGGLLTDYCAGHCCTG
jgi:hypothetical protein